jgi:uncharacterized Zn-binding protein involved in type VI secretion
MIATTIVNGLTVVHKASDGIAIASAPDVCKTPPTPLPLPYPNIALSSDLANGTVTVLVDGQSVALKDSEFSTSSGDEPGTVGGIISGVNKGKAKFSSYSMDVRFEGRNVARLSDSMTMNGNQSNTATTAEIQANLQTELGGLLDLLCKAFCWCDAGKDGGDFVKRYRPPPPGSITA